MDVGSGAGYPAGTLSNFTPRRFVFDGVECASMEGLLQSLKFENPDVQREVCKLVGKAARFRGKPKKWWQKQKLYWQGVEYNRHGREYQDLLDRAYKAMFDQCESFRNALRASGDAVLTHSIGRTKPQETILTRTEFCSRLMRLRNLL